MGTIQVLAERNIEADATTVYGYLADLRQHHPRFLPSEFSDFEVLSGGVGAGTVASFKVTAGGRTRAYRMEVSEPEPGRVLVESDANSSLVTTFKVTPADGKCSVRITTTWQGAGGVGGIFERLFAPKVMQRIYQDELDALNRYALEQKGAQPQA